MLISRFGEFFSLPDRDSSLLEPLNNLIVIKMPQLIPFFFFNQLLSSFLVLAILVYVFSKYILPSFTYTQMIRLYITKLIKNSK